jgi:hypothetical protein
MPATTGAPLPTAMGRAMRMAIGAGLVAWLLVGFGIGPNL